MRFLMKRLPLWIPPAVLCLGLSMTAFGQNTGSSPSSLKLLGKMAPPLTVQSLDGKPVSLASYRGKAVLVNFWATWCGNCKVEMPWLAQLRDRYSRQGFEVLGIVTDGADSYKVQQIANRYGVKYPILLCNHKTAQAYGGLPDLPESFFVNRQGKVVAEMDGADSKEEIERNIRKALGMR